MAQTRETALPVQRAVSLLAGTPFVSAYELQNDNGSAFDMTGYTILAQARATVGGTLYGTFTESLRTDAAGTFTLTLAASVSTAAIAAGVTTLHADVWLYLTADHAVRFPVDSLVFTIEPAYTVIP